MSDWTSECLNQLVAFQKGRKVETSPFQTQGFEPYLGAGALSGRYDGYASTFLAVTANKQDVLMLWDGERSGIVGYNLSGVVSSTVCKLTPNEKIDNELLYYLLLFNFDWIQNRRTGTGVPHVPKDIGRILKLDYPTDIYLQQKVTRILQAIDQDIEKTEALIEKYQHIKAGLMRDLFTRGIDADGKLRPPREQAPELYQQTPIGWIPKEWEVALFGEYIEVIDPNPSHRYPLEVDDGYPICSTENFQGEDGFNFENVKRVPQATYQAQNNRCRFKTTDVIYARKGKIGLARRYGEDIKVFSHTVVVMKPSSELVGSDWLLWLTRSDWLLKAIEVTMNTNSGVPTRGVEFIKNITVPFPKNEEQKIMHTFLESASNKIQAEREERNKLIKQKSGLMQDLLTGKVPVTVNNNIAEVAHG